MNYIDMHALANMLHINPNDANIITEVLNDAGFGICNKKEVEVEIKKSSKEAYEQGREAGVKATLDSAPALTPAPKAEKTVKEPPNAGTNVAMITSLNETLKLIKESTNRTNREEMQEEARKILEKIQKFS